MTFRRLSRLLLGGSSYGCSLLVPALACAALAVAGCQKKDDHPPYLAGCEVNCSPLPGIEVGLPTASGGASSTPDSDAGPSTLTGQVLLLADDSFVHASLYANGATVTADGASGTPVTATWDGADPYQLDNVSPVPTNWVSVKPDVTGGDALLTYQAVQTNAVTMVNLAMVSATTLDGIFTAVSSLRSPDSGQIVLFFRSAGTGAALSGLHVAMPAAQLVAYASSTGWVLDDGTGTTGPTGLVLFGNVESGNSGGTQNVTVTKAATATSAAVAGGTFAVKVVAAAVTLATVSAQL